VIVGDRGTLARIDLRGSDLFQALAQGIEAP
jgi:hypothetical protein